MAKITTLQPFKTIDEVKIRFGVLPRPFEWRLLALPVVGSINGIPTSQGTAIATNGILVAIVQGKYLFIGHIDSFVADETETVSLAQSVKVKKARQPKSPDLDISEFI